VELDGEGWSDQKPVAGEKRRLAAFTVEGSLRPLSSAVTKDAVKENQ
jgi:hypothetical protein